MYTYKYNIDNINKPLFRLEIQEINKTLCQTLIEKAFCKAAKKPQTLIINAKL